MLTGAISATSPSATVTLCPSTSRVSTPDRACSSAPHTVPWAVDTSTRPDWSASALGHHADEVATARTTTATNVSTMPARRRPNVRRISASSSAPGVRGGPCRRRARQPSPRARWRCTPGPARRIRIAGDLKPLGSTRASRSHTAQADQPHTAVHPVPSRAAYAGARAFGSSAWSSIASASALTWSTDSRPTGRRSDARGFARPGVHPASPRARACRPTGGEAG